MKGADLTGVDLRESNLERANLKLVDFTYTHFENVDLSKVVFVKCLFHKTYFINCSLFTFNVLSYGMHFLDILDLKILKKDCGISWLTILGLFVYRLLFVYFLYLVVVGHIASNS